MSSGLGRNWHVHVLIIICKRPSMNIPKIECFALYLHFIINIQNVYIFFNLGIKRVLYLRYNRITQVWLAITTSRYHFWRMTSMIEAYCTGKCACQLLIKSCVIHEAMNGCKNLKIH